ncbi:flagellin [Saccharophagus degradans]|uniref:Flagellin n=1 Tax=Saccharophagus degradans (strain 2-40 / ATCC 43961 / DSM 17024) TaxID=203122 RepID=Q21IL7_SACD2|nr:flagellin [Saccharophagus degradans]ABD81462.1 flagellin-like protein [Saccharophagus degradans 2-40]
MPLVINTNVAALNAQRQLVASGNDMSEAMERLSSGKRINTARDDAAGLAISNRMTSQIRGLDQAVRNANDGVSMIQTAEGALDEVTNILQRMRELSIQSANGIYSDTDRSTLDAEVQQLKAEVDRIAKSTSFNGQPLLDGSLGSVSLQVGAEANQTIALEIPGFNTSSLGGASGDIVGGETAAGLTTLALFDTADAAHTLYVNDTAISDLSNGTTLNDKLAIINADLDGKGATASSLVSVVGTTPGNGVLTAGVSSLTLALVDGDGNSQSYVITDTNSLEDLRDKINSDTTLDAKINDDGKLVVSKDDGTSIAVTDASGASGLATGVTTNFSLVLTDTSAEKNGVKFEVGAANGADIQALGIDVHDDNGNLTGTTVTSTSTNTIQKGDLLINGVAIPAFTETGVAATTVDEVIEAINSVSDDTGVVAYETGGNTAQISLRSSTGDEISIEYGDNATAANVLAATGLQERNAAEGGGSVSGISIGTAAGAQKSIDVIDKALEQINSTRSQLGAVNNRLDFTMSNLSNVAEKTSAAKSRIVDADFAKETSELSRAQVLQQASQAMLAQANAQPQQVLQLLQG